MTFAFDPAKPPGQRIDPRLIQVADELINLQQMYKICIKSYIHNGCDGFTMFKNAQILVCLIVRYWPQIFMKLKLI